MYREPEIWRIEDDVLYFLTSTLLKLSKEIANKRIENRNYGKEFKKAKALKELITVYERRV